MTILAIFIQSGDGSNLILSSNAGILYSKAQYLSTQFNEMAKKGRECRVLKRGGYLVQGKGYGEILIGLIGLEEEFYEFSVCWKGVDNFFSAMAPKGLQELTPSFILKKYGEVWYGLEQLLRGDCAMYIASQKFPEVTLGEASIVSTNAVGGPAMEMVSKAPIIQSYSHQDIVHYHNNNDGNVIPLPDIPPLDCKYEMGKHWDPPTKKSKKKKGKAKEACT